LLESFTETVKVNVPVADGFPATVAELPLPVRVTPVGNVPLLTVHPE
jgi:hypothetical protein